jgi:hypothetical protein
MKVLLIPLLAGVTSCAVGEHAVATGEGVPFFAAAKIGGTP